MEILEIQPDNYKRWDAFVSASPQGTIYHSSSWKEVVDAVRGYKMRLFAGVEADQIIGGCCLTEKKKGGLCSAVNALGSQYAGWLFAPAAGSKISDQISSQYKIINHFLPSVFRRYHYVELHNAPGLADLRPLIEAGWTVWPRYTYFLDLSSTGTLWEEMEGRIRRLIRKAVRADFEIKKEVKPADFFNLLAATFARQREKIRIQQALIKAVLESQALKDHCLLLGAYRKDKLVAAVLTLFDQRRGYYAFSATDADYLPTGINSLLIWEHLNRLAGKVEEFDFLGANIPSIARFKEGFNPRLGLYFAISHYRNAIIKLLHRFRRRLVNF